MTGWVSRAGGFHIYRSGGHRAPAGRRVASLRRRDRAGSPRVASVRGVRGACSTARAPSLNRDSRALFEVRRVSRGISASGSGSGSSRRRNTGGAVGLVVLPSALTTPTSVVAGRLALAGGPSSQHEQQVAQSVEVAADLGVGRATGLARGRPSRARRGGSCSWRCREPRSRGSAPGTMKTSGRGRSATSSSMRASRRSRHPSASRGRRPAVSLARWSGFVARSAPTTNSSRCSARISSAIDGSPVSDRASPSTATASSVVP